MASNTKDKDAKDTEDERTNFDERDKKLMAAPLTVFEPLRSDPIKNMQGRQKRLDRLAAAKMPEVHYVGQIVSGKGLIGDSSEGASCRWKFDYGPSWMRLCGDDFGQSQVAYSTFFSSDVLQFNHPIDVQFAEIGMQGWGAARINVQVFKFDAHGRRMLQGYGFTHLPTSSGRHRCEVALWRPVGTQEQEMDAFFLGRVPALTNYDPIYLTAWNERCRLMTTSAGSVLLDLHVIVRYKTEFHGIDDAGQDPN